MKRIGVICEYNPFHIGHEALFRRIRKAFGPDTAIVCAMSGNYVQRGAPAILDKSRRAGAAIACGADLVVELPLTVSLSSAEGFAAGGVQILARLCDTLAFGTESADRATVLRGAEAQLSLAYSAALRGELDAGKSFPAARQAALETLGLPPLSSPNDLLAAEYAKAILSGGLDMEIFPVPRAGDYHTRVLDPGNPSATAVRDAMLSGRQWRTAVPEAALSYLEGGEMHTLAAGERAVLARLRAMDEAEFEALPYGSEGLWRKLFRESRQKAGLEEILAGVKSKRYTRTRLDRMVMCAFLGISRETLGSPAPYVRVLAFNDTGRALLREDKKSGYFRNAGEAVPGQYWELERRVGDLYGLFSLHAPESPGAEKQRRVLYIPGQSQEA